MKKSVIICAAGKSTRFSDKSEIPKQFFKVCDKTILEYSVDKFINYEKIDTIIICIDEIHKKHYQSILNKYLDHNFITFIKGGKTRDQTVYIALNYLKKNNPDIVFVHDAARPNFDLSLIDQLIDNLMTYDAIIPISPITDTIKKISGKNMVTKDRESYFLSQTPQLFKFNKLLNAHKLAKKFKNIKVTDDAQIIELNNLKINTVINTTDNFKITTLKDYMRFRDIKEINNSTIRVGIGFDVHKFKPGKVLRLFGVNIPYTKSLEGHSDADVGLHAITDSIYGALGLEDIGFYFNPNNSKWKNADSKLFLADALNKLNDNLGLINNIDIVVICEEPKINLHRTVIKNKLSELLSIPITRISVKATTTEKLGFTGRKEGIAVQAIVNIGIRNQRYE